MMRRPKGLIIFILVSFLLHILFSLMIYFFWKPVFNFANKEKPPIWIDLKKDKKYQIADIEKPNQEQKPQDSSLLGMYDSSVTHEQVSVSETRKGQVGEQNRQQKREGEGTRRAGEGGQAQALTPSTSSEFYPDIRRGNKTYLNVLRYPEVQYFVQLKKIFRTTWNPNGVITWNDWRSVDSDKIEVILGISIDASGKLAELFIAQASPFPLYDNEGLRAVRSSAPFAAPPAKFLTKDGLLHIAWTFSFYR